MARAKKRNRNSGASSASPRPDQERGAAPAPGAAPADDRDDDEEEEAEASAASSDESAVAGDEDEGAEEAARGEEEEEEREERRPAAAAAAPRPGATRRPAIRLSIKRQDAPGEAPYWEDFVVEDEGNMNVISCLMAIQKNPVTADGRDTTPVVWDQACLEEVCGSCTMVINGRVRQSCSALIDKIRGEAPGGVITLEPMRKFPVVRDLWVDRQRMFEALKKVRAWVPIDGTYDLGPGPKIPANVAQENYVMSTCMTCGCCLDACPQVNEHSDFIGAAAISQARLFNANPTGAMNAHERVEALMEDGGVHACGNAQNCVEVCPKEIPLTTSIAEMGRQITAHLIRSVFKD